MGSELKAKDAEISELRLGAATLGSGKSFPAPLHPGGKLSSCGSKLALVHSLIPPDGSPLPFDADGDAPVRVCVCLVCACVCVTLCVCARV